MTNSEISKQEVDQPEPADNQQAEELQDIGQKNGHDGQDNDSVLTSNLGFMPTWAWLVSILAAATIAAVIFGFFFMGQAKTRMEEDPAATGIITPTYPAATTSGKHSDDSEDEEPGVQDGYGYEEPGDYGGDTENTDEESANWYEPDENFDEDTDHDGGSDNGENNEQSAGEPGE